MFNRAVIRLLLGSTILSSLFSAVMISLTVYHHFKIKELITELDRHRA